MLRLFFIFAVLLFAVAVAAVVFRWLKSSKLDWTGIAFAAGFVALAFYLHQVTGIGWL
jgi:hypothetical protein